MSDVAGGLCINLRWTIFDGGARKNKLEEALANVHAAEAQVNVTHDRIAVQVWAAYPNWNTAFRQRQAAIALLEAPSQSYAARLEPYNYGVRTLLVVTTSRLPLARARSAE